MIVCQESDHKIDQFEIFQNWRAGIRALRRLASSRKNAPEEDHKREAVAWLRFFVSQTAEFRRRVHPAYRPSYGLRLAWVRFCHSRTSTRQSPLSGIPSIGNDLVESRQLDRFHPDIPDRLLARFCSKLLNLLGTIGVDSVVRVSLLALLVRGISERSTPFELANPIRFRFSPRSALPMLQGDLNGLLCP